MTNIKTNQEIKLIEKSSKILTTVIKKARIYAKPGITKLELDQLIEKLIIESGAKPSFKGYKGYKFASCLSVNNEVVHGLPDNTVLTEGDILGIDIGVNYNGYNSDAAVTIGIGKIDHESQRLINITKQSLDNAIKLIKPGIELGIIQKEIEKTVESKNYCLVRSFSGHGIGKNLQEEPIIPNYYGINSHLIIKPNAVFCLEPMVIIGKNPHVNIHSDKWTVITANGKRAAHFEHTIVVTKNSCKVLTK